MPARTLLRPSRLAPWFLAALGLALAGCWASFPEDRFGKHPDAAVPDLFNYEPRPRLEATPGAENPPPPPDRSTQDRYPGDLMKCIPKGQIACTADNKGIIACSETGYGTVVIDCSPFQCQDSLRRCNGCLPGSAPTCDKKDLVTCTLNGLPDRTTCPTSCKDGACL
jgi:hypothetical protein